MGSPRETPEERKQLSTYLDNVRELLKCLNDQVTRNALHLKIGQLIRNSENRGKQLDELKSILDGVQRSRTSELLSEQAESKGIFIKGQEQTGAQYLHIVSQGWGGFRQHYEKKEEEFKASSSPTQKNASSSRFHFKFQWPSFFSKRKKDTSHSPTPESKRKGSFNP